MSLPTFLGIGTQRGATTWLHHCISEHPEICVAARKELYFFDTYFDRGVPWYAEQFRPGPEHRAVGEITPTYLSSPKAIERIAQVVPDAHLFAVLREPVSRAYSAFKLYREKRYSGRQFSDVCTPDSHLVQDGMYARQLEHLFRFFPREQVTIFLFEQIAADPAGVVRELFGALGVDATFTPASTVEQYNQFLYPRTQRVLRAIGMGRALDCVRTSRLGQWIKSRGARQRSETRLAPDFRQRLVEWFRDDVERLQGLLGRDLSAWLA